MDTITGTVELKQLATTSLPGERTLRVYLPPGYRRDLHRRYPVLYLHDGQNVFSGLTSFVPDQEWKADEAAESLIDAGLIEPIIIAAIDNAGEHRADEFLPTRAQREDGASWGGEADRYAHMLVTEIKPFIDRSYRTRKDASNSGLGGASFGGIITLYIGLRYPHVFGKLAVMSPSLWWDDGVMLKQVAALPGKQPQKYWIDMGTHEAEGSQAQARELGKLFESKGWKPGKDLAVYIDGYAAHRESAWARRFPTILMFLFGRQER